MSQTGCGGATQFWMCGERPETPFQSLGRGVSHWGQWKQGLNQHQNFLYSGLLHGCALEMFICSEIWKTTVAYCTVYLSNLFLNKNPFDKGKPFKALCLRTLFQ